MFSNLQINRTLVKNVRMNLSRKAVSAEEMQEEWLEIQAAQTDPAQFRVLYNRYFSPIFRFVFRRTADEDLTNDICSQVFLKAMQKLPGYQFRGVPFSAWLYRIASNEVTQHFRHTQKNRTVSMEETDISDMFDEMQEENNEQLRAQLLSILDDLKEKDLQLIEMRFFEQRPFKEIADILEITESNAKVKTYRILDRLKKKLTLN